MLVLLDVARSVGASFDVINLVAEGIVLVPHFAWIFPVSGVAPFSSRSVSLAHPKFLAGVSSILLAATPFAIVAAVPVARAAA